VGSAIIISIRPEFAHRILAGTKTIELRRSAMGLEPRDVVLVYISAPDQCLGFWFRVAKIETLSVDSMWSRHQDKLGVEHEHYIAYFDGSVTATGLHVTEVTRLTPSLPLAQVQDLVPGFVPPQGLIRLRDTSGHYEKLLAGLPRALPVDAFPQQSLFAKLSGAAGSRP
jgi:predicted transcriptional regulator